MALPPATPSGYQLWYYYPSLVGNVIFAAVFGVLAIVHLFLTIRTKRYFCIPLVIGSVFETVGYAFRILARDQITKTSPYAAQSVLILLGPILLAASTYMCLGRIITGVHGEHFSIIRPRIVTRVFVSGDILCFMIQAGGGGLMATAKSSSNNEMGQHIILGGLILQIVIFFFFVMIAIVFHVRMVTAGDHRSSIPWKQFLLTVYAVSSLITIRNIIRAVEYATGSDGYLLQHEWIIFVFDGIAMTLVLLMSLAWYKADLSPEARGADKDAESYILVTPQYPLATR